MDILVDLIGFSSFPPTETYKIGHGKSILPRVMNAFWLKKPSNSLLHFLFVKDKTVNRYKRYCIWWSLHWMNHTRTPSFLYCKLFFLSQEFEFLGFLVLEWKVFGGFLWLGVNLDLLKERILFWRSHVNHLHSATNQVIHLALGFSTDSYKLISTTQRRLFCS